MLDRLESLAGNEVEGRDNVVALLAHLASDVGAVRDCNTTNMYGTCDGTQTCDPAAGWSACNAQVPIAELYKYSTSLRSITQGRATHSREFSHCFGNSAYLC